MRVTKTIQTPGGPIQFDGDMTTEEYERVFEFGLLALYQAGMMPFMTVKEEDRANVMSPQGELH